MTLFEEKARVAGNEQVGDGLYLMRLYAPRTAAEIAPGQFVHMTVASDPSHILRRPFSVFSADAERGLADILYQTVGAGTAVMAGWQAGAETSLIAPIGSAWTVPEGARRVLLVGGGVGAAPLFMFCERLVRDGVACDVVLGASTQRALVCRPRYDAIAHPNLHISCSTDDGTYGRAGFATTLVEDAVGSCKPHDKYDLVAVCGPEPLMRAVAAIAHDAGIPCQASLERRMACGIGACLSCVVDTKEGKKRACVDGPVFDTEDLIW